MAVRHCPNGQVFDPNQLHCVSKIPKGQYDNLPKVFTATNGGIYFIQHIHTLMPADHDNGT